MKGERIKCPYAAGCRMIECNVIREELVVLRDNSRWYWKFLKKQGRFGWKALSIGRRNA